MTDATQAVDLRVGAGAGRRVLVAERAVMRAAHPVAFPVLDRLLAGRPARRVPGLGVLVADPVLVRQVLADKAFRKDGPGSSGALWSGVLGPRTLIGMEGPGHRTLRRALSSLFTPQAAHDVCARVLAAPLERLRSDLAAGRQVDLVPVTRSAATSVIAALIGMLREDAGAVEVAEVSDYLLAASDEVLGMVRLGTRQLSARQRARVTTLLEPVSRAATAAYDSAVASGGVPGAPLSVLARLPALGISRAQAPALAAVLLLTGTETMTSATPRTLAMLVDSGLVGPVARALAADDAAEAATTEPSMTGAPASGRCPSQRFGERARGAAALDAVVTESLRLATPSAAMLRRATRDGVLGGSGVEVRRGDRVLLATWWATRRGGGFAPELGCPAPARQLWFGAGPHFCLGASLAVAEIDAVVRSVLAAESQVGSLRVVERRAARRVLVPSYSRLVMQAGP